MSTLRPMVKAATIGVAAMVTLGGLAANVAWAAPDPASGPVAGGSDVRDVISGTTFTRVSAGAFYSIALTPEGHVYTWGRNDFGQLGNGTRSSIDTVDVPSDVTPDSVTFAAVAAGAHHSLALTTEGRLYAWGQNAYGQVGNGASGGFVTTPTDVTPGAVTFAAIAGGTEHSMALATDGTLYTWGDNGNGQLGNGTSGGTVTTPTVITPTTTYTAIAAGTAHSMAVADGSLYTWGDNGKGQLGNGTKGGTVTTPTKIDSEASFATVAAGSLHSMALTTDGHLHTWGWNFYGQLGNGNIDKDVSVPSEIAPNLTFTAVTTADTHSMALTAGGRLYTWGGNEEGQLGNGASGYQTNVLTPTDITPDGLTFTSAAAGSWHSMALSQGHPYTWGWNLYGQLGDGTSGTDTNVNVPTGIGAVTVTDVLFGALSATVLSQSGNTWMATSPTSPTCGPVDVTVTYNQFGTQHTATTPSGFTYTGTGPEITTQPASTTLAPGGTFTATARASGQPTPTIDWQQSTTGTDPWTTIPGATAATLTTTPNATTYYRAVFTGCNGTATTAVATATVTTPSPADATSPGASTGGTALPRTGADPTPLIATAIALLGIGITTVTIRRKSAQAHRP